MAYPATQTYWLEPTDQIAVGLRRYSRQQPEGQPFSMECSGGYHSALVYIDRTAAEYNDRDGRSSLAIRPEHPHDDPRWPAQCSRCEYTFTDDDPPGRRGRS